MIITVNSEELLISGTEFECWLHENHYDFIKVQACEYQVRGEGADYLYDAESSLSFPYYDPSH